MTSSGEEPPRRHVRITEASLGFPGFPEEEKDAEGTYDKYVDSRYLGNGWKHRQPINRAGQFQRDL